MREYGKAVRATYVQVVIRLDKGQVVRTLLFAAVVVQGTRAWSAYTILRRVRPLLLRFHSVTRGASGGGQIVQ